MKKVKRRATAALLIAALLVVGLLKSGRIIRVDGYFQISSWKL